MIGMLFLAGIGGDEFERFRIAADAEGRILGGPSDRLLGQWSVEFGRVVNGECFRAGTGLEFAIGLARLQLHRLALNGSIGRPGASVRGSTPMTCRNTAMLLRRLASATAIPTALASPWASGPVVTSMPVV